MYAAGAVGMITFLVTAWISTGLKKIGLI